MSWGNSFSSYFLQNPKRTVPIFCFYRKLSTVLTKPVYISTPVFYVNSKPHIGHLYSAVLGDCLKRYHELKGSKVILSTGTDEHGSKIKQAAANKLRNPQEFCDEVSQQFKDLFNIANIEYSKFIRTTDAKHKEAVQTFWERLINSPYVYKDLHEGWYSISDEAFYTAKQVKEIQGPTTGEIITVAIESGQQVTWMSEENYKFRLPMLRDRLLDWLDENPSVIEPKIRMNEVKSMLETGLQDVSISRSSSRVNWAIAVPDDPEQTIYVWVDALINYLTATGFPWQEENPEAISSKGWPADIHIIGKDILRFHAILWPAFLMATHIALPKKILAHSHWTMGQQKMSKSRGNVADPFEALAQFGVDAIRYFLMRDGGISDDSDYSVSRIQIRYHKELAGQLGNLLSRSTSMALNPSRHIPQKPPITSTNDLQLVDNLTNLPGLVNQYYEKVEFSKALEAISNSLAEVNKYITENQPWMLIKNPDQTERVNDVLYYVTESVRIVGILLQPIMPAKMKILLDQLGVKNDERQFNMAQLGKGWPIKENLHRDLGPSGGPLFASLKK